MSYDWVRLRMGVGALCLLLLLIACAPAAPATPTVSISPTQTVSPTQPAPTSTPQPTALPSPAPSAIPPTLAPTQLPELVLPISVYILADANDEMSSTRTVEEIAAIYERVNAIWAQANIRLDVRIIEHVTVSQELLVGLTQRNFYALFDAVNRGIVVLPNLSQLTGFYVSDLGGPNGIAPSNTKTFFVMDTPSVHDERVTSHEIGHILGLHHVLDDANRLLFSGTNGMLLSADEITVARYAAQGLLAGLR